MDQNKTDIRLSKTATNMWTLKTHLYTGVIICLIILKGFLDFMQCSLSFLNCRFVVVVLGFYFPPTANVIRRRDLDIKSHPKDWRSPGLQGE